MQQKINLFPLLPPPKKYYLPFRQIVVYALLMIGLFLIITFIQLGRNIFLHSKVNKLRQQESELALKVEDLNRRFPKVVKDQQLEEQVLELAKELAQKQKVLFILKENKLVNISGFSDYLKMLSESIIHGVWLTNFSITSGGERLELSGRTYLSSLVFDYRNQLDQVPLFSKAPFEVGKITSSTQPQQPIKFDLTWGVGKQ